MKTGGLKRLPSGSSLPLCSRPKIQRGTTRRQLWSLAGLRSCRRRYPERRVTTSALAAKTAYGVKTGFESPSLTRWIKPVVLHGDCSPRTRTLRHDSGNGTISRAVLRRYPQRPATIQLWFTTKGNAPWLLQPGMYETPQPTKDSSSETRGFSQPAVRRAQTSDAATGQLLRAYTRDATRISDHRRVAALPSEVIETNDRPVLRVLAPGQSKNLADALETRRAAVRSFNADGRKSFGCWLLALTVAGQRRAGDE